MTHPGDAFAEAGKEPVSGQRLESGPEFDDDGVAHLPMTRRALPT